MLGGEGLEELRAVCDCLTDLVAEQPERLTVNYCTSLHLTLATHLM